MTQQSLTKSLLKHSQPLLTKCLQAALIAAPVMLAAAPSHAAIKTGTIHGFTDSFAPANWDITPPPATTGNSASLTSTTLTLVKNNGNQAAASAFIAITPALLDALNPQTGYKFVSWHATGKYTFTGTGLDKLSFTGFSNDQDGSPNPLSTGATPVTSPTNFSVAGFPFSLTPDDQLGFQVARLVSGAATGTGTITDFKFTAKYDVPGPLPIVGAAAAFAWSRKLRNRLKPANTLA